MNSHYRIKILLYTALIFGPFAFSGSGQQATPTPEEYELGGRPKSKPPSSSYGPENRGRTWGLPDYDVQQRRSTSRKATSKPSSTRKPSTKKKSTSDTDDVLPSPSPTPVSTTPRKEDPDKPASRSVEKDKSDQRQTSAIPSPPTASPTPRIDDRKRPESPTETKESPKPLASASPK